MNDDASQTSLEDKALIEIQKLKEENFILQGKLRGYVTLGDILREQKNECAKLKKMNEELQSKVKFSTDVTNKNQQDKLERTCILNHVNGTNDKLPEEFNIESENIDVSLKSGQSVNGIFQSPVNGETRNVTHESLKHQSWTGHLSGVAYPPDDIFRSVKTDKFPTQESESLNSANELNQKMSDSHKQKPVTVIFSSKDLPKTKEVNGIDRSTSTIAHVGSDVSSKSLNLMEFPPENCAESANRNSGSKVVSPSSSQSSSFQIVKPSLSRQGSRSETALSLHVCEIMNGDLGTDGPTTKVKKLLEDILPELTNLEDENHRLKIEKEKLCEENSRLLNKVQQLELRVNNVSPTESLSSQTQVVEWEHISKSDLTKSTPTEKEATQKTDDTTRLGKLEQQNRELLQANSRWEKMFKEMRSDQENKTRTYQTEIDTLRAEITKMKLEDEKRQREYDKILLTTKNRLEDEETAKEALQAQLIEYQATCEQLQREKREVEESLNSVHREQLAREAELSVLRQGMNGNSMQPLHQSSESELRTEIAVLREQLTVFQEDFDRERQDRAAAQSEKDELTKQLGKLKVENNRLVDQKKRYLAQLHTAEVNVKEALEESTRLNNSNIELKNKIRHLESQLMRTTQFTPNITSGRPPSQQHVMVQPETDPYARPSPPYLFQTGVATVNVPTNLERYPSEQQPGAWNCDDCTYSNHPSRTVCEMCGKIRTQGNSLPVQHSSESPILWRRGENGEQNDLATDCGR